MVELSWLRDVRDVVNNIMRGKMNNTGSVTLTANSATTTLQDPRIGGGTVVTLGPTTANAAAEIGNGTLYYNTPGSHSIVINHANNAQTDRTFNYVLNG
jgi:hypothetical protein